MLKAYCIWLAEKSKEGTTIAGLPGGKMLGGRTSAKEEDSIQSPKGMTFVSLKPGWPGARKIRKLQRKVECRPPPKQAQCWSEQLELFWLQTQLLPPELRWRGNQATIGQSWKQRTKWVGTFIEMNYLNSAAKLNQMKQPGYQQQTGSHPCCCGKIARETL